MPHGDAGDVRWYKVFLFEADNAFILLGAVGHFGNDTNPHPEFDVGFDHIRIDGGEYDVGIGSSVKNVAILSVTTRRNMRTPCGTSN